MRSPSQLRSSCPTRRCLPTRKSSRMNSSRPKPKAWQRRSRRRSRIQPNVKVVEIDTGPVNTQFELELEGRLRLSKVTSLADDLAIRAACPGVPRRRADSRQKHRRRRSPQRRPRDGSLERTPRNLPEGFRWQADSALPRQRRQRKPLSSISPRCRTCLIAGAPAPARASASTR